MEPIETTYIHDFNTYLRTLDFKDPFIAGLCLFHICLLLTVLLTRQYPSFQIPLFLTLLSSVYFSENVNELLAHRWQLFSLQNYFDSSGMFISICYSMPVLINCILIIGLWLYDSMQTMVKVKKAQMEQKVKFFTEKVKEKEN